MFAFGHHDGSGPQNDPDVKDHGGLVGPRHRLVEAKIPLNEWPAIIYRGALPLSMPIVLLGGIYSGAFTPTEAAAVAAFHALILAGVVYRALTWRTFWGVVMESTRGSVSSSASAASTGSARKITPSRSSISGRPRISTPT